MKCTLVIRNYNPDKIYPYVYETGDVYIGDTYDFINLSEIEIYDGSMKLQGLTGSMSSEWREPDGRTYQWYKCFDGVDSQESSFCSTDSSINTNQPSMLYVNLDNRKFDTIKIYNRLIEPMRIIGAEIYVLQGVDDANNKVWSDTFRLSSNKAERVLTIAIFSFTAQQLVLSSSSSPSSAPSPAPSQVCAECSEGITCTLTCPVGR